MSILPLLSSDRRTISKTVMIPFLLDWTVAKYHCPTRWPTFLARRLLRQLSLFSTVSGSVQKLILSWLRHQGRPVGMSHLRELVQLCVLELAWRLIQSRCAPGIWEGTQPRMCMERAEWPLRVRRGSPFHILSFSINHQQFSDFRHLTRVVICSLFLEAQLVETCNAVD
jgi:hypothetical protein